jgi:hypothetical protein
MGDYYLRVTKMASGWHVRYMAIKAYYNHIFRPCERLNVVQALPNDD